MADQPQPQTQPKPRETSGGYRRGRGSGRNRNNPNTGAKGSESKAGSRTAQTSRNRTGESSIDALPEAQTGSNTNATSLSNSHQNRQFLRRQSRQRNNHRENGPVDVEQPLQHQRKGKNIQQSQGNNVPLGGLVDTLNACAPEFVPGSDFVSPSSAGPSSSPSEAPPKSRRPKSRKAKPRGNRPQFGPNALLAAPLFITVVSKNGKTASSSILCMQTKAGNVPLAIPRWITTLSSLSAGAEKPTIPDRSPVCLHTPAESNAFAKERTVSIAAPKSAMLRNALLVPTWAIPSRVTAVENTRCFAVVKSAQISSVARPFVRNFSIAENTNVKISATKKGNASLVTN
ncbi:FKBP12-associated protein 1-like protein [Ceratocystis lukuohia]|uniref:FKBP12-associated protein 1-like protein n=1 Tax=Ceratocystis lukuohia TaxID=2019550 RepID=A0ABR4MEJ6_9PEZI